ncbi:MAG TPA: hypothetical protein VGS11_04505 [Candidatus Bathyarchaeia archaeon]|nr:hypothetical protein [Candidatus Bathyarchaeia archaeon]
MKKVRGSGTVAVADKDPAFEVLARFCVKATSQDKAQKAVNDVLRRFKVNW